MESLASTYVLDFQHAVAAIVGGKTDLDGRVILRTSDKNWVSLFSSLYRVLTHKEVQPHAFSDLCGHAFKDEDKYFLFLVRAVSDGSLSHVLSDVDPTKIGHLFDDTAALRDSGALNTVRRLLADLQHVTFVWEDSDLSKEWFKAPKTKTKTVVVRKVVVKKSAKDPAKDASLTIETTDSPPPKSPRDDSKGEMVMLEESPSEPVTFMSPDPDGAPIVLLPSPISPKAKSKEFVVVPCYGVESGGTTVDLSHPGLKYFIYADGVVSETKRTSGVDVVGHMLPLSLRTVILHGNLIVNGVDYSNEDYFLCCGDDITTMPAGAKIRVTSPQSFSEKVIAQMCQPSRPTNRIEIALKPSEVSPDIGNKLKDLIQSRTGPSGSFTHSASPDNLNHSIEVETNSLAAECVQYLTFLGYSAVHILNTLDSQDVPTATYDSWNGPQHVFTEMVTKGFNEIMVLYFRRANHLNRVIRKEDLWNLPNVVVLDFTGSMLGDPAIGVLSTNLMAPHLKRLSLSDCNIHVASSENLIQLLCRLNSIVHLDLSKNKLGNKFLMLLSSVKSLRYVNLRNNIVTTIAFRHFVDLPLQITVDFAWNLIDPLLLGGAPTSPNTNLKTELEKNIKDFFVADVPIKTATVTENQRYYPLIGWGEPKMYPDPSAFVHGETGVACTNITHFACPSGGRWLGQWYQITESPKADDEGWEYNNVFTLGAGIGGWREQSTLTVCRRRVWQRRYIQ